jgi:hypothetical protein
MGREVCEKKLEVISNPYYNLVILNRKANEGFSTYDPPGGPAGPCHHPTHGRVGDGRGLYPTATPIGRHTINAGAGTALFSPASKRRVTTWLGFCLMAEPDRIPCRSEALTPS